MAGRGLVGLVVLAGRLAVAGSGWERAGGKRQPKRLRLWLGLTAGRGLVWLGGVWLAWWFWLAGWLWLGLAGSELEGNGSPKGCGCGWV